MKLKQHTVCDNKRDSYVGKVAQQLRDVFLKLTALSPTQQKYVIKTYLNYLLYKKVIEVHTASELQVFIYKLAKEIFNEYDVRTNPCHQVFSINIDSTETIRSASRTVHVESSRHDKKIQKQQQCYRKKIIRRILAPYRGLTVSADNQNKVENELQQQLHDYLVTSELALEYVVDKVADRLITAMEPKVTMGVKLIRLMSCVLLPLYIGQTEKKYLRVKKYHERGLLKRDCKQMYKREIMKYASR